MTLHSTPAFLKNQLRFQTPNFLKFHTRLESSFFQINLEFKLGLLVSGSTEKSVKSTAFIIKIH